MQIQISDDAGPIFRQITDQIRHRILSGVLNAGDELPTIRSLASTLAVNPNTVVRAYRELEHLELIEKRRTAGTFVRGDIQTRSPTARRRQLHEAMDTLISQSRGLGFQTDELIEMLTKRASRQGGREER